nr:hypothetical protein BaRGS_014203 [Batillaria attramentaria]
MPDKRVQTFSYSYQDLQNLQSELFRNYSKSIRPLLNQSRVLDVEVALDTLDIVQADDVRQEVVLRAVLLTSWIDELLMWTPDLHGGLNSIHPERDIIWAPSIRMAGMEDENGLTSDWMGNHLLLSDGSVFIRSTGQLSMNCKFHLAFFPFDTQTCSMDFYVQDFTEKEVQLLPAKLAIVFDRMEPNGQWEIVSGSARTFIHGSGEQTFSALSLDLVMRRLYLFYVLNILLPYVLISLLTLLAFLVPAEGGERATFALTALLAQSRMLGVEAAFDMLDIVHADDVRQELVLRAVMWIGWTDELLTWTPEQHVGLKSIHPERDTVWAPSIRVAGIDDESGLTSRSDTSL